MMQAFIGFFLAIGILVTVHEWGHFAMARRLGVRVLRFSIGFGPILWRWKDRKETEYCLSLIPLGGYVKLYGERAELLTAADKTGAFYQQALWKRAAVVLAGPLINFVLAWFLLIGVFTWGLPVMKPIVGTVAPTGLLAKAGMQDHTQILSVDGQAIHSLEDLSLALLDKASTASKGVRLQVQVLGKAQQETLYLPLPKTFLQSDRPDFFTFFQAEPLDPVTPMIESVLPGSAAEKAGLKPGDILLKLDNQSIQSRYALVQAIQARPNQSLLLTIEREGQQQTRAIKTQAFQTAEGEWQGKIGIQLGQGKSSDREVLFYTQRFPFTQALVKAGQTTFQYAHLTLKLLYKMLIGEASPKHMGGPFTIAKQAGSSLDMGLLRFMQFLALVSVSLGVLNLLPVPMLDGGHLLFYAYEAIRGQAMALSYQLWAYRFGLVLVMGLIGLALYNDFLRFKVS